MRNSEMRMQENGTFRLPLTVSTLRRKGTALSRKGCINV